MIGFLLALYGGSMVAGAAATAAGASRGNPRLRRLGIALAILSIPILAAALILAIAD